MCGRYTFSGVTATLAERMGIEILSDWTPSYNIAPGSLAPVIHDNAGTLSCEQKPWGIAQAGRGALINIRSEGRIWRSGDVYPCLIPADGFYEWDRRGKPWYFYPAEGSLLMAACLKDDRFGILTRAAADEVGTVHHRQPVLFTGDTWRSWFESLRRREQLIDHEEDLPALLYHQVSDRVNQTRANDPALCRPGGQISLWGLNESE